MKNFTIRDENSSIEPPKASSADENNISVIPTPCYIMDPV
jgi:hypothetical protein